MKKLDGDIQKLDGALNTKYHWDNLDNLFCQSTVMGKKAKKMSYKIQ